MHTVHPPREFPNDRIVFTLSCGLMTSIDEQATLIGKDRPGRHWWTCPVHGWVLAADYEVRVGD